MQSFPPSRAAGLDRLAGFLPRAGTAYAARRNFDLGPEDRGNVSLLSPYVRHRLVTEAEVVSAALDLHGPDRAEKFVQEQLWRTYWKGWLEMRPSVWRDYQAGLAAARRRLDREGGLARAYAQALAGRTGIDCFDAWVGELAAECYLHNHARMWFASIWIFTLRLPWELGADLFMAHLLDGDPASNTLSWRWVAGLQTRGKTYLARPDNIRHYTGGRFDPRGLATHAEPLDGPEPPRPEPLVPPRPPLAGVPTGLLLHEEDMALEVGLDLPRGLLALAVARLAPAHRDEGAGEAVTGWVDAALDDTAARAGSLLGLEPDRPAPGDIGAVVGWARAAELRQVVAPYAPVGPAADALAALGQALEPYGIALCRVARRHDLACWPHATRGFFTLKEKIPRLVADLGYLP